MKEALRNFSLILVSILASLLALEIGYRSYQQVQYDRPFVSFSETKLDPFAAAIVGHPLAHYVPNPALHDVDESFMRTTPEIADPALVVAAVGGSTTYDTSVPVEHSYPYLLQRDLHQHGYYVKVFNAGAPSYRLAHIISRYVHQVQHVMTRGGVVIIDVGHNDIPRIFGNETSEGAFAQSLRVVDEESEFLRNFRVLNWLRTRLDNLSCEYMGKAYFKGHLNSIALTDNCGGEIARDTPKEEEIAVFKTQLRTLLRILRSDGLYPIVMLQDFSDTRMSAKYIGAHLKLRAIIVAEAVSECAYILDMRRFTKGDNAYFDDALHMNRPGNEKRADILRAHIVDLINSPEKAGPCH